MLLATSITQEFTTTPIETKTVTTTQSFGTTSTDKLSTAFKKMTVLVSSPTVSEIILATSITQDFTTTPPCDTKIITTTQSLGTTTTDIPSTASITTTTLLSSPTASRLLLATNITKDITTTPGKTKTVTTSQPHGTMTTYTASTAFKQTTTPVASPAASKGLLATSFSQYFTNRPGKTKTVATSQSLGTTTTDIPSTASKKATLVSSPTLSKMLLPTSITQDYTTTHGKIKTVAKTQSLGTTTTDTLSTALKKMTNIVSSPTVSKIILATSITQDFTTTPGNTKTKKTTQSVGTATTDIPTTASKTTSTLVSSPTASKICPDIVVRKSCNGTAVIAKEVAKVAAALIIDPLISALKEKWKKKIAEWKG